MSNTMETQSNDIDAFWQVEDAKKQVLAAVRKLMQRAQLRFEGGKDDWGSLEYVSMSVELANELQQWADWSMRALADCLHERASSWYISGAAGYAAGELKLELRAEREAEGDVFECIDALIEECFED